MKMFTDEFVSFVTKANPFKILKEELDLARDEYSKNHFEFYMFKEEIAGLLRNAKQKGFDDVLYCELAISLIENNRYEVVISAYFRTDKVDKVQKFVRKLALDQIGDMPERVERALRTNKAVTIKVSNIEGILLASKEQIERAIEFEKLIAYASVLAKKMALLPAEKQIKLKDELFSVRVTFLFVGKDGKQDDFTIRYSKIKGIPVDIVDKMEESGDDMCVISV